MTGIEYLGCVKEGAERITDILVGDALGGEINVGRGTLDGAGGTHSASLPPPADFFLLEASLWRNIRIGS